ncbi:SRPBCC domain-containing protein [Chryseobacterium gotjawalense]|uniref:SRPBCC domain-containing protein n=1 Tax=Chryseobacterium gotjawalense TaxID=3042315 RepID=A0ABY8RFW0_9FLAO|nr:SRPBCC domain-containing protein [Chryseobacterium sp. wdc7]WHF52856.1 SRPBCC domain-containing protein [Chryseobacterium sp. wdc7]
METLDYEIHINAPIQKVWDLLWNPETYPIWTQFFAPDSQMKSDWKVGGKTYFTNQKGEGMVSTIESLDEPNEVVFKHLGIVKDGVEDTYTKDVKDWSGAEEKYFLRAVDENMTQLRASLHTSNENEDLMNKGFKEGFAMLKKLAEKE